MFDAIAARYDLLNTVLSGGIDRYWRWRAVRSLALTGRETAVDLCTGTADLVVALGEARTRGPGRRRRFLAGHAPARPRQGPIPRRAGGVAAGPGRRHAAAAGQRLGGRPDHRLRDSQRARPRGGRRRLPARPQAGRPARHPRDFDAAGARSSGRSMPGISPGCCRGSGASSRTTPTPTPTCRPRWSAGSPRRRSAPPCGRPASRRSGQSL